MYKRQFYKLKNAKCTTGLIVSEFANGVWALVFKHKAFEIPGKWPVHALAISRVNASVVWSMLLRFAKGHRFSNIQKKDLTVDSAGVGIPLYEEAMEMLKDTTATEFGPLRANARRGQKMRCATPLQNGILCYGKELEAELRANEESNAMIYSVKKPGPHFLDDFVKKKVLSLPGVHCEMSGSGMRILHTTFRDAISQPSPGKPLLYLQKTCIFVGVPGTGKSELVHGFARECCKRNGQDFYSLSQSMCPLGIMTKNGKCAQLGAICFEDFEMRTRGGTHMITHEEAKGILYVKARGHYQAFYHQAILPEWIPRLWSVNYGADDKGNLQKSEWFEKNRLPGCKALADCDEKALRCLDGHGQAEARRAVIFFVDESLFDEQHQAATDAAGVEVSTTHLQNATSLD